MVRMLIALASISAIAGPLCAVGVAACSDSTVSPMSEDGAANGSTDGGKPPRTDEGPGEVYCFSDDPVDVRRTPYKPARIKPGSCSENVISIVGELLATNDGTLTASKIADAVSTQESAACAECIVGEDGDTWAPLVAANDGTFTENVGGCLEVLSGEVACGKAIQQFTACLATACSTCTDDADRQYCVNSAQASACKDAQKALIMGCGAGVNSYIGSCFTGTYINDVGASVSGTIRELCVAPAKDAGMD
jgi:hypothetical protein